MGRTIEFYVIDNEDTGQPYVYSLPILQEAKIVSKEQAEEVFQNKGHWESITVVRPFKGSHDREVENRITGLNIVTQQTERDAKRWAGALIETAVESWTIADNPPSEALFYDLPLTLREAVLQEVTDHCYPSRTAHPDFLNYVRKPS